MLLLHFILSPGSFVSLLQIFFTGALKHTLICASFTAPLIFMREVSNGQIQL
jgi:hypothetical protein